MLRKVRFLTVYFACFFIAMFSFMNAYKATYANSDSGSGSFVCHSNCGNSNPNVGPNTICEPWKYPGIYVKLVYYDPSGTEAQGFDSTTHQKIIAGPTKVYPINKNYGAVPSNTPSPFGSGNNNWLHTEWVAPTRYVDFDANQFVRDTVVSNSAAASTKRNQFIRFLSKMVNIDGSANSRWNIDLDTLNEPSCEVDLNHPGNCYRKAGYRLIAELYLGVATNGGTRPDSYVSSKEIRDRGVNGVTNTSLQTESRYMSIRWSDINYACNGLNGGTSCTNTEKNTQCLLNKNCGYGIWIVDISSFIDPRNYDYRLDMACNNCNSTTNKSMVIQDTTDWEDITGSSKVTQDMCGANYGNIKNYFKKATYNGTEVFCREEYHVTYPNEKNKISIFAGRYFTVNETQANLNLVESGIPNFAPIEVERIRECRDSSNGSKLTKFNNDTFTQKFTACTPGNITLNYNDKTYKYKDVLDATKVSQSSNITGNSLTQRVKYSYRLKPDVFRYVRIRDGYSLKNKPTDFSVTNNNGFKDLLVSNLPVAFSTYQYNKINFKYELPEQSNVCDTHIKEIYNSPDYLNCTHKKTHDFYNQSNPANLRTTACSKLYNTTNLNNQDFKTCVDARKGKAGLAGLMGNCKQLNALCNFNSESECSGPYLCNLKVKSGKPTVCDSTNAGIGNFKGMVWDEEGKVCCEEGTKYASKSGKCCKPELIHDGVCDSKSGTCTKDNHKSLGRDWNENENVCCPVNYKYDVQTKKCEPPADDKCELLGCGNACCYDENKNPYCGTTLNGQLICPGKPNVHNEVYRTIDTTNPFLNQNGNIRDTGENWCSNRSVNGKIVRSCSGSSDNSTVSSVITSKNISEDNAMYKAHLNSSSIDKIRRYNESHSYDDFNFECNSKGDECKSVFIRKSSYGIELTGRCSSGNFGNC